MTLIDIYKTEKAGPANSQALFLLGMLLVSMLVFDEPQFPEKASCTSGVVGARTAISEQAVAVAQGLAGHFLSVGSMCFDFMVGRGPVGRTKTLADVNELFI